MVPVEAPPLGLREGCWRGRLAKTARWYAVALVLAGLTVLCPAVPVMQPLVAKDFADLGAGAPATGVVSEPFNYNDQFTGTVLSQAYELQQSDSYLYLYQVENAGPSVLEVLGVCPFYQIEEAGYLTANQPAPFLDTATGLTPYGRTGPSLSYDADLTKPVVSFNYPSVLGAHLPAGDHSVVLYLISPNSPVTGDAYVIDGGRWLWTRWSPCPSRR